MINSISDEENSKFDYFNNYFINVAQNFSEYLPSENQKEKESEDNNKDTYNEKIFSKEFKDVFDKKEKLKSIGETTYNQINFNFSNLSKKSKCFPFTEGDGIKKCLEKLGYNIIFITPNKINILHPMKQIKKKFRKRFEIYDFSEDDNGKLKKFKNKKRRFIPDDIRKKIKSKFHKCIKNIINKNLKSIGSKKLFDFFPQNFTANITIRLNKLALNYSFEELLKTNIASSVLKLKANTTDKKKQQKNLDVLKYLDRNPLISKISSFDIIKKMKYKNLLKAYFISKEFENSIIELHQKKEKVEYIEKYVNEALGYIQFFSLKKINPKNNIKSKKNIIEIVYDDEDYDIENEEE